jgi:hypothetical protein
MYMNLQDQTTPPLDLYFTRAGGAATTLAVKTTPIHPTPLYDIDVTDATDFVTGTYVGMFSGGGRYYFGTVVSKLGTVLTMDTPMDFEFEIGSPVLPTSREMNVDGSVTPITFSIQAGSSGLLIDLTRVMFAMILSSQGDDGLFGNLTTTGFRGLLLRKVDGVLQNYWNVKDNSEIRSLGYDLDYTVRSGGGGSFGMAARYTLGGPSKHGTVIRLGPGEALEAIVQDDYTGLVRNRLLVGGHQTNEMAVP